MSRSAVSQLAGVNLQKISGERVSDLGLRSYVLYDESAAFAPELRRRVPDARIILRLIVNSSWDDPERTAREAARLAREWPQVDLICPANEQNYENGASGPQIAAWCERFLSEYRRRGSPKPLVTPGVSTTNPVPLSDLAVAWAGWDYIGVHAYWDEPSDPSPALAIVAAHRAMWPGLPQVVTEFNCGGPGQYEGQPWRHNEVALGCARFLEQVASFGYVEGGCWFLLDSDDQPYRLTRMPEVMAYFRSVGHERGGQIDPPPANGGTPMPGPLPIGGVTAYWSDGRPADPGQFLFKYPVLANAGHDWTIELHESPDGELELRADAPPDVPVSIHTSDGANGVGGNGHASVIFGLGGSSAYHGGQGPWVVEVPGASVTNIGWRDNHRHTNIIFKRRAQPDPSAPPAPLPPGPPVPGGAPQTVNGRLLAFGFLDLWRADPGRYGQPTSELLGIEGTQNLPAARRPALQMFAGGGDGPGVMLYRPKDGAVLWVPLPTGVP